jgi:hypothetical protein
MNLQRPQVARALPRYRPGAIADAASLDYNSKPQRGPDFQLELRPLHSPLLGAYGFERSSVRGFSREFGITKLPSRSLTSSPLGLTFLRLSLTSPGRTPYGLERGIHAPRLAYPTPSPLTSTPSLEGQEY